MAQVVYPSNFFKATHTKPLISSFRGAPTLGESGEFIAISPDGGI
jgi:hypothetical protein